MKCFAWRRVLFAAMACVLGGTASQATSAGEVESSPARGTLADAAVVAGRIASPPVKRAAEASTSSLVYQPQSQWALHVAGDDAAALDAALDLSQPVKIHTPLAQRKSSGLDLLPGEPAHEILELMESSGGSVLDGTLFNSEEYSAEQDRLLRRNTIVQTIRQLQEEDICEAKAVPVPPPSETLATWTTPASPAPVIPRTSAASIDEMRRVCDQLDRAASDLERQELYHYADQLRETARQMRLEARSLAAHSRSQDAGDVTARPAEDSSADIELQMLRDEVNRLRQQLESRPTTSTVSYPRYGLELEPSSAEIRGLFIGPADE